MPERETVDIDSHLFSLITMLASSAWCQLGKMQDPVYGKMQVDLQSAKITIEMLLMLRVKTMGNLTKKEEEMLTSTISNLQINYADEVAKSEKNIKK